VLSQALPLLSIVVLLFPMFVFTLASPPLLVLKHDTPLDGRFIRNLFNLYYIVVIAIAAVDAAGFAITGQGAVVIALGTLVVFVFGIRRWMISNMDRLRDAIARGDATAVPKFRRLHIAGIVLNVLQLGAVAAGMTRLAV
jgi:hypothetical protein